MVVFTANILVLIAEFTPMLIKSCVTVSNILNFVILVFELVILEYLKTLSDIKTFAVLEYPQPPSAMVKVTLPVSTETEVATAFPFLPLSEITSSSSPTTKPWPPLITDNEDSEPMIVGASVTLVFPVSTSFSPKLKFPLRLDKYNKSTNLPFILFFTNPSQKAFAPDKEPKISLLTKLIFLGDVETSKYLGLIQLPSEDLKISSPGK